MVDVVLALIFFWIIGWVVHKIMGKDGNFLHFIFIGGAGCGLGTLLEWITNRYTTTFAGAIGLCIVCALVVEYAIRKVKHKLWVRKVHKRGWLTQEDIKKEFGITDEDLQDYEDVEFDDD